MELKKEAWIVTGGFTEYIRVFDNEVDAREDYNKHVVNDSWCEAGSLVHRVDETLESIVKER